MLPLLKNFSDLLRARWLGQLTDGPLVDRDAAEKMLERSRVPAVLMLMLVWVTAAVVLILSWNRQYDFENWQIGRMAPRSVSANNDFEYEDKAKTEAARETARNGVPEYYRPEVDSILDRVDMLLRFCVVADGKKAASGKAAAGTSPSAPDKKTVPAAAPSGTGSADPGYVVEPALASALADAYRRKDDHRKFMADLKAMLENGIVADHPRKNDGVPFRIVGREGNFTAGYFNTIDHCSRVLAAELLPKASPTQLEKFGALLKKLIGEQGNLRKDEAVTEAERRRAAATVKKVMVTWKKGDTLIRKGEEFTRKASDSIRADRERSANTMWGNVLQRVGWSFFVMLGGVFFICFVSKNIRRDNLRILLAGLTIALALAANYLSIIVFEDYLMREISVLDTRLLRLAIPVAFCAAVLSVVLDLRTAVCAGGIVAVISALMVTPYRALELALIWTVISSGVALAVRDVGNYRSFFMRTMLTALALTWALNWYDVFFHGDKAPLYPLFKAVFWTILAASVLCAILALMTIFVLEQLFNLSTDMALMMLSDYNNPLLKDLRSRAGGTMSHSLAVATLAEDGARAIGANPVRARAGALFHDIGKLVNTEYFTENNPVSSRLHDRISPEESSRIIRGHVAEGVALARKKRLCRFIRDVITTHHGDDLVLSFYKKAQEQSKESGKPVLEEQFRYRGEPPRTKEESIISLADACEAASRSLKEPTPERIDALVGDIIGKRFVNGMLRKSSLSAAELDKLREAFTKTLSNNMHVRIAYPDEPADNGRSGKC